MTDQKKINSLQLLRAIAVSFVIFIHCSYFGVPVISSVNPVDSFHYLKSWGAIGVDLFFAISGFVMTVVAPAHAKPGGWRTFFIKRIIRIVPLYYLLSAYELFANLSVHHAKFNVLALIKSLIFFPIFDQGKFVIPILHDGWSLSYEMYFYTLIGIVLIFRKDIYKRLLLIILLLGVTGIFLNPKNPLLNFLTSPILLEFGFGIVCGLLYKKFSSNSMSINWKKTISTTLVLLGLGLMISTIFIIPKYDIHDQSIVESNSMLTFYRIIIWGVPCAVFLLGTTFFEDSFNKKIPAILILAGDASYSCYLIHPKIYLIVAHIFKFFPHGAILFLVAAVPTCLLVSIGFYKIVERSLTSVVNKYYNRSAGKLAVKEGVKRTIS